MKTSARSHRRSALQAKLGAWDDVASQSVTRTVYKNRNWLLYTTAIGSALAMATDAGAQIIQYGGTPPAASINAGSGFTNIEPFVVGPANFNLEGVQFPSYGYGAVAFGALGNAGMLLNGTHGVRKLASGANISNGDGSFIGGLHLVKQEFGSAAGSFTSGVPAFAGIALYPDGRPNSTNPTRPVFYGWVELEFGGSTFPTSVEAISWAYNSVAGQPIQAGQTTAADSPAPEPGTAALSLLAMGAAGVLAWRRKKAPLTA